MNLINPSHEIEGRAPGQPIVQVRQLVIDQLGEPHVNYDQLEELVHGTMGIPTKDQVKIKMYGRAAVLGVAGFHFMYTNTVHVNPIASQRHDPATGHMRTLFHELSHLADSKNHRARTLGEYLLRNAAFRTGLAASGVIGGTEITPDIVDHIAATAIPTATFFGYYAIDPAEKRARKSEKSEDLMDEYGDVIYFGKKHPALDFIGTGSMRNAF